MKLSRRRKSQTLVCSSKGALDVSTSQRLSGTYSDDGVESLAHEDGEAQVFTSAWGTANGEPRAVHAINRGAEVSSTLVSHQLHGTLPNVEQDLERMAACVPLTEHEVLRAIDDVEVAELDKASIAQACRDEGVGLPDHHWRRAACEVLALALLGLGDLYFTATTFEVFGLSDRSLGFLPFNELQLVASSTVVALLLLARIAGHELRILGHLMEAASTGPGTTVRRSGRIRKCFTAGGALVAIAGALGILIGLSEVRSSYLAQSGIDAHASQFLLIQLGIATSAIVLSLWMAHPYDQRWRSAVRHSTRRTASLTRVYGAFAGLVGEFNGLLRYRCAVLNQHNDWSVATTIDAARKGQMYARRVLLAQPEPTREALLPSGLPVPAVPLLLDEIAKHHAGEGSVFKDYAPCSTATVEVRLAELDRRRTERIAARAADVARPHQLPPDTRNRMLRGAKKSGTKQ